MGYYLGIDGGGTKTVAAVCDENGNILLKETGKTINFYSVGMQNAKENLAELISAIYIRLKISKFQGAFIGCSALDRVADEETLNSLCGGIINAEKIGMDSDVFVALAASGEENCRAVAICGTGSIAIGKVIETTIVKGGWGHVMGDEGSAYSIAVNALKACAILYDENKKSILTECANSFFGVDDFRKVIEKVYDPKIGKDVLAAFATVVGECAESDVIARTVIVNECHGFSRTVISLLENMGFCQKLSLYGGVFKNNAFFRECFIEDIKEVCPSLKIELLSVPAEEGALKVARSL